MAKREANRQLRVLAGGRRGDVTAADVVETLTVAAGHLRAGNRALGEYFETPSAERRGRPRGEDAGAPAPRSTQGDPLDDWPVIGDRDRVQDVLRQRAFHLGAEGTASREVFGRSGGLSSLIGGRTEERIAAVKREAFEHRTKLQSRVVSARLRADAQSEVAQMHDRHAAEVNERLDRVDARLARVDEEERLLKPGQRGARVIGLEAATAAAATGLADGAAFILTLSALGGALLVRVLVAVALGLALNVAVLAAGRTLAAVWLAAEGGSRRVRVVLLVTTLLALDLLIALSLGSAGDFRHTATTNLAGGVSVAPRFLMWVAITAVLGATLSLGWWHYSSEGDRLWRRRRQLETERAVLAGERTSAEHAALCARGEVFEILADAARAQADLDSLPARLEHLAEQEYAEGRALLGVTQAAFREGRLASRRTQAKADAAVMDGATERAVDDFQIRVLSAENKTAGREVAE